MRTSFALLLLCVAATTTLAQTKAARKDLLLAPLGGRTVAAVDVKEVTLPPGMKAPYHLHPCPVVGYVVAGTALVQIEGDSVKVVKAGEAFYEPAEKPITHFDNASPTEPLTFVAYYLTNGENELVRMLPGNPK